MTWYEELGLTPTARDEEIRKAHRTLSRLLHPDQQMDPALRGAAELQMRRINTMVDALLDAKQRKEYDDSLSAVPQAVRRVAPVPGPTVSLLVIVISGAILTTAGVWFFAGDLIQRQGSAPAVSDSTRTFAAGPAGVAEPGSERKREKRETPDAIRLPARQKASQVPETAAREIPPRLELAPPPPVEVAPVVPLQAPEFLTSPAATLNRASESTRKGMEPVDGVWVYAQPLQRSNQARLYAPEYIELHLRSEESRLAGKYLSRYHVPDRAISPNVAFAFEGRVGSDQYEWRAADGSRGVVELKRLTPESMQVDWRVVEFGSRISLGAGTAVLIRRTRP